MKQILWRVNTGYLMASLVLFVCLLITPNAKADTDSAIDTAALYAKAFGKPSHKKTNKFQSNSSNKQTKNNTSTNMGDLFAKAFGKKTIVSSPEKINVDFRINQSVLGDIELLSNSQGMIDRTLTKPLLGYLSDVLKSHVFQRFEKKLNTKKQTTFSQLRELGIQADYNLTNLSLDIEIKPELRKPQIFSLNSKRIAKVRKENVLVGDPKTASGYLNSFINVGLNSRESDLDLRMRLEGSFNYKGYVLESTIDYRNSKFETSHASLTYDQPEKLKRFTLGNITTGNRNYQENLSLDGIRISKEFFLDPQLQITPRANESIVLESVSEIELFINNQLIRRFYLNAGIYTLEDIGLYDGANNIRIRIKDEFGKVTVKTSKQYYDSHLLKPGLSLFAFSVGYLNNKTSYSNTELEKRPIISGYYQRGLSETHTLSLDAQLSAKSFLLGAESIRSITVGSLKNSIAFSGGNNRSNGYATSFEFKPNKKQELIALDTLRQDLLGLDTRSKGLINGWSITGEYRSSDFLLLSGIDSDSTPSTQASGLIEFGNRVVNDTRLRANLQTNISLNINSDWQGTLNLGVADFYNRDESYYTNLSTSRRFNNGSRISLGARYDTNDKFSMNLQFSIPLEYKQDRKRIKADFLADSRDGAYETKLTYKPTSTIGKNSFGASLEHYENHDARQQHLNLQYRSPNFETKLAARNRHSKFSNTNTQHLDFGFNTALACVGNACERSYPISDSFALVSGPTNQTQAIAINNNNTRFRYSDGNDTGLPDNYSALIPHKNKKAVVRLESYRSQNINIDEGTLPNGYDAEKTEFSVFPNYHQGFLLKAGGEPATTVDGMLLDDVNKTLGFKGGQWIPENSKGKTVAFFSNKAGMFRVTSIPAGKYKLKLFDFPDMEPIHINVPDTKGEPHDIGKLIIKTAN